MVKKLPENPDYEAQVIATIMRKPEFYKLNEEILNDPAIFNSEKHRTIFLAIKSLNDRNRVAEITDIFQELAETASLERIGGREYISNLALNYYSGSNIEMKILKLHEMNMKRQTYFAAKELMEKSLDETTDAFNLVGNGGRAIFEILDKIPSNKIINIADTNVLNEWMKSTQEKSINKKKGIGTGLQTGFNSLDEKFGGFKNSDLIIIAARPAMGKTALALCLCSNQAFNTGKPIGFISLEMSREQLQDRYMSLQSGVFASKISNADLGEYDWDRLNNSIAKIQKEKILIEDSPAQSIDKVRANCRKLVKQFGCIAIYIDYLQLIHASSDQKKNSNREQDISHISRTLKEIARELKIPIFAISQLSRSVETRGGDKKPMLSDLRESGAIEQDADVVIFIYRPEYYGIKSYEGDGSSTEGIAEIIYAKYRNGQTGTVPLHFDGSHTMFTDIQQPPPTIDYLSNSNQ